MWTVAEMGIEHCRYDVGGAFGGTQDSEYLAMKPMGRVPVIKDDLTTLFQSQAIMRCLAAQHGSENFWPSDPMKRAPVDQGSEWSKISVAPVTIYIVFLATR